jgi:hypothetical protein
MTYEERQQHDKLLQRYEESKGVENTPIAQPDQEAKGYETRTALCFH